MKVKDLLELCMDCTSYNLVTIFDRKENFLDELSMIDAIDSYGNNEVLYWGKDKEYYLYIK